MRNIVLSLAIFLLSTLCYAQEGKSIYKKYSDEKDVQSVYISPSMFKLVRQIPVHYEDEELDLGPIVKTLSGFYLIDTYSEIVAAQLAQDMKKYDQSSKYELFMEVNDGGEKIRIYAAREGEFLTSLVMTAVQSDGENTFVCLDGKILESDIEGLLAKLAKDKINL